MRKITTSFTTIQTLVYMKVYFKSFPKSDHLHKSDKKRRSYDHFKKEVHCCFGVGRWAASEVCWAVCSIGHGRPAPSDVRRAALTDKHLKNLKTHN